MNEILVLVVEDDDDTRNDLSISLGAAGYRVIAVPHYAEALSVIIRRSVDLAIIDRHFDETRVPTRSFAGDDLARSLWREGILTIEYTNYAGTVIEIEERIARTGGNIFSSLRKKASRAAALKQMQEELLPLVAEALQAVNAIRESEGLSATQLARLS